MKYNFLGQGYEIFFKLSKIGVFIIIPFLVAGCRSTERDNGNRINSFELVTSKISDTKQFANRLIQQAQTCWATSYPKLAGLIPSKPVSIGAGTYKIIFKEKVPDLLDRSFSVTIAKYVENAPGRAPIAFGEFANDGRDKVSVRIDLLSNMNVMREAIGAVDDLMKNRGICD